ncbi:hypothetical protein GOQ27_02295 [Clostridium sp. D2Q-11]|uniref:Uncharacterized protein n=1 Tax=Anaeromonas frigoriresistens TaxID=2683708 RepID=A0A942UVN2_9FIRM|nr:hypothetical protein [Anaeromonas frigoriresistens]MBS4537271.1 hypothetical protein [Anaeromonas frigoriresistens]
MKILKLSLLLILIVIIVMGILLFTSNKVDSTDKLDKEFLVDKLVLQSQLDIYSENSIKFSEKEVNGLISPRLKTRLNSRNDSSSTKFEEIYLNLNKDYIYVQADLDNLPFVLNMKIDTTLKEDKISFTSQELRIGKLPIPQFLLDRFGLNNINDSLYIDTSEFNEITITNIELYENNLEIDYKTNNDQIVEKYIQKDQQKFIKTILTKLEKSEESRSLANNIVKAVLLTSADREISQGLIDNLKEDFINLDSQTKTELVFTMIKYNINYILNLVQN